MHGRWPTLPSRNPTADVATATGTTRVVVNLGETAWPIPEGARVLVASGPEVIHRLPTDHAVWLADVER